MRILQVHNFYREAGGEDRVAATEYELLTSHGHTVTRYLAHNDAISAMSGIEAGIKTIWNAQTYSDVRSLIQKEAPALIHAHNTFPLISPALYYAAAAERVPVIQTLHNYRLLCPAAGFFRDGHLCEECLHSAIPYPAVLHRCYRQSAGASAAAASMLLVHRIAGTWKTKITTYIALTNFAKRKFVEGGLPADRIVVKPNCLVDDPGIGPGDGGYALFVGRLSAEKGLDTLFAAWQRLGVAIPLKIAGDGPLAAQLAKPFRNVKWLGNCGREQLMTLYRNAAFVVFPSNCYEGLPNTIIESLACGTPVIASNLGSMQELIVNGVNGFHFNAGDPVDLADCVASILAQPDRLRTMRHSSRLSYEQNYTPERNYELLMQIYTDALHRTKRELVSA